MPLVQRKPACSALPSDEYARRVLGLTRYDLNDGLKLNDDQAFSPLPRNGRC